MIKSQNSKAGFTLLEILLVVGIIAILAGIVILAINPTKQLGDARNAQRRSDVITILNAVYQFSIDHNGVLPTDDGTKDGTVVIKPGATSTDCVAASIQNEIMRTDTAAGDGTVNLYSSLVQSEASSTYVVSVPVDPLRTSSQDTGYHIFSTAGGRVTVCAAEAESGVSINVTR